MNQTSKIQLNFDCIEITSFVNSNRFIGQMLLNSNDSNAKRISNHFECNSLIHCALINANFGLQFNGSCAAANQTKNHQHHMFLLKISFYLLKLKRLLLSQEQKLRIKLALKCCS